jgi:apolipoprotein D and lipocalin family protein
MNSIKQCPPQKELQVLPERGRRCSLRRFGGRLVSTLLLVCGGGCVSIPDGITPAGGFEPERYLGRWHEIARLDHSFERGLSRVTAEYSRHPDGGIRVLNRGYDAARDKWKQAEGRAYFVGPEDQGFLKVSFFGPFYGSYVIFHLDSENYHHALVCGPDRSYFWILCREPKMAPELLEALVARAAAAGFDTGKLIFPEPQSAE